MTSQPSETVDLVLAVVDLVPRGSVVSYGDVAGLVGTSARRVGAILNRYGSGVPWWRVVSASGQLPTQMVDEARARWIDEGITLADSGRGCRIVHHRADLIALGQAYARVQGAEL